MEKIRIGMIGCGGNASGHLRRIMEIPEVEVVGLTDTSEESFKRLFERIPEAEAIPRFSDYKEMLASVEMDATEISTPHTGHFEQIIACFDQGLHVLTEKPMVCTVEHALEVMDRAKAAGVVFMVSYQRHFAPSFRFMRNQIGSGEIGEVQFITAMQDQNWYRSQQGKWRQVHSLSGGGQLNDSGSHLLDIVLWMTDLVPAEVSAYMEYFDGEVDINSALSIRFTNGALGNLSVVGNSVGPGMWEDITIWGSKGVIYSRNGQLTCKYGGRDPVEIDDLPSRFNSPDENFIDAILGRDEVQVPAECGLRVIQLSEAAWASAEKGGRPVKVKSTRTRKR
ncbi:MAG: Gfo/Idh/MocA family oxidoreductase [Candidatus Latescibacteria bacterium]|jgi:predicted dehydrogenase|nr:Gfo/Idh/MocA family oxidoreductase [Candidatus Latescibacterota bacterium]